MNNIKYYILSSLVVMCIVHNSLAVHTPASASLDSSFSFVGSSSVFEVVGGNTQKPKLNVSSFVDSALNISAPSKRDISDVSNQEIPQTPVFKKAPSSISAISRRPSALLLDTPFFGADLNDSIIRDLGDLRSSRSLHVLPTSPLERRAVAVNASPPRSRFFVEARGMIIEHLEKKELPPLSVPKQENIQSSSQPKPTSSLEAIIEEDEFVRTGSVEAKNKIIETVERIVERREEEIAVQIISYEIPSVSKTLASNLTNINFDIGMRMDNLTISAPSLGLPISGVASGDSLYKHGAWGHATMSTSRQKETAQIDAFKTKGRGMIFGYDIQSENDNTYGLAYGFNDTKLKFTLGDSKEKIKHHVVSVYSNQVLGSNWSMPFSICYGKAFIKTHRDFVWNGKQVTGKTKANTWNVKTGLVYDYTIPKHSITLTPSAHLVYERVAIDGFVENGTCISKSKSWLVSNIVGVSIQRPIALGNSQFIPELHYGSEFVPNHG